MNESFQKVYEDRLNKLKSHITKEFLSETFKIEFESTISVSAYGRKKGAYRERVPRIDFAPSEEFMTDLDSDFDEVLQQAIRIAKDIFDNPPFPDRNFQGEIVLDHGGAVFRKRSGT